MSGAEISGQLDSIRREIDHLDYVNVDDALVNDIRVELQALAEDAAAISAHSLVGYANDLIDLLP